MKNTITRLAAALTPPPIRADTAARASDTIRNVTARINVAATCASTSINAARLAPLTSMVLIAASPRIYFELVSKNATAQAVRRRRVAFLRRRRSLPGRKGRAL